MKPNDHSDLLLLRPEEVARRCNLSRTKVYELIKRGDLPSIRIGRCRRIPVVELEAWIAQRMHGPDQL